MRWECGAGGVKADERYFGPILRPIGLLALLWPPIVALLAAFFG
jgi:hypothetical protein